MSETKERLLKRLRHNSEKIKDPTIRQLLLDAYEYVNMPAEGLHAECKAAIDAALAGQISVFEGEEHPTFRQGPPNHELEHLLTAEEATNYIKMINLPERDKTAVSMVAEKDKEVLDSMMNMTLLMEQAGFIGIMETYKAQKYRLPECIKATRGEGELDGQIVSYIVTLADGTEVTLRNPETIEAKDDEHPDRETSAKPEG